MKELRPKRRQVTNQTQEYITVIIEDPLSPADAKRLSTRLSKDYVCWGYLACLRQSAFPLCPWPVNLLAFGPSIKVYNQHVQGTSDESQRQPSRKEYPELMCDLDAPRSRIEVEELHAVDGLGHCQLGALRR